MVARIAKTGENSRISLGELASGVVALANMIGKTDEERKLLSSVYFNQLVEWNVPEIKKLRDEVTF